MTAAEPALCVYGAGSVGCYLGGRLLATGSRVRFVGRPALREALLRHGLTCTDLDGAHLAAPPAAIDFATDADAVREAEVVMVTVKSAATDTVAAELASRLRPGVIVVSFQNGLGNAERLRAQLPQQTVLTGMVPFNVLARGEGRFHHGSGGQLAVQADPAVATFAAAFARAGLPIAEHADIRAVQWAKLLLNLNNSINALSGLTLKEELSQRAFRRCLAAAQAEALVLLNSAGIPLAQLTKVRPQMLPTLLRLPDWLFRRVAKQMVAIDPLARSSTWEDLEAGRPTEVDWINGEVVRLAELLKRTAPINARLVALVKAAERGGRRDWTGPALLHALRAG